MHQLPNPFCELQTNLILRIASLRFTPYLAILLVLLFLQSLPGTRSFYLIREGSSLYQRSLPRPIKDPQLL
jgi:hypothetical protein